MTKFRKGDKVAVLSSWDNKGTVMIRRGIVHSAGNKVMRLQDDDGKTFKCAFRPENNTMDKFNGLRVIVDADDATLQAEAMADGERVNTLWIEEGKRRIALGDEFNAIVGQRYIDGCGEPAYRWYAGEWAR